VKKIFLWLIGGILLAEAGALEGYASVLYRWRDPQGTVHVSDTPPASGDYKTIQNEGAPHFKIPLKNKFHSTAPRPVHSEVVAIPLHRLGSHFLVKMRINSRAEGLFLLDTGASLTLIHPDVAREAGIDMDSRSPVLPIKTASGIIFPPLVRVESLNLGGMKLDSKEMIVHDLHQGKNISGLIGMDILSDYQVTLDTPRASLILTPLHHVGPVYGGHSKTWWRGRFDFYRRAIHSLKGLLKASSRTLKNHHITRRRIKQSIAVYQDRMMELNLQAEDALVPLDWR